MTSPAAIAHYQGVVDWAAFVIQAQALDLVLPLQHVFPRLVSEWGVQVPPSVLARIGALRPRKAGEPGVCRSDGRRPIAGAASYGRPVADERPARTPASCAGKHLPFGGLHAAPLRRPSPGCCCPSPIPTAGIADCEAFLADGRPEPGSGLPISTWLPLLQETLQREGRFRVRLRGDSMRPSLPADAEIEIVPAPAHLRLGDIIVFHQGDELIAHRLVARRGERLDHPGRWAAAAGRAGGSRAACWVWWWQHTRPGGAIGRPAARGSYLPSGSSAPGACGLRAGWAYER